MINSEDIKSGKGDKYVLFADAFIKEKIKSGFEFNKKDYLELSLELMVFDDYKFNGNAQEKDLTGYASKWLLGNMMEERGSHASL